MNSAGTLDPEAEPSKEAPTLLGLNKAAEQLKHMKTNSFRKEKNKITEVTQ